MQTQSTDRGPMMAKEPARSRLTTSCHQTGQVTARQPTVEETAVGEERGLAVRAYFMNTLGSNYFKR